MRGPQSSGARGAFSDTQVVPKKPETVSSTVLARELSSHSQSYAPTLSLVSAKLEKEIEKPSPLSMSVASRK